MSIASWIDRNLIGLLSVAASLGALTGWMLCKLLERSGMIT